MIIIQNAAAVQFNFSTSQLVISEGGDLPSQLSIVKTGQHQGNITVDIELTSTHPNDRGKYVVHVVTGVLGIVVQQVQWRIQDFIKGGSIFRLRPKRTQKIYIPHPLFLKPPPFSACFGEEELALPTSRSV